MDDSRIFPREGAGESGRLLHFRPAGSPPRSPDAGEAGAGPDRSSAQLSTGDLFGILWLALADILGTAAAATLLRRAAQRALPRWPELASLNILRERLEYRFRLPTNWKDPVSQQPNALSALASELWPLLVNLTGSVVVRRLAQIPELRAWGTLPPGGTAVSSNPPTLQRLTTGSAAFDRILGGGLPRRSVNVIAGAPGAGKTLFSLQMLFALARQGKQGLYFTTLSEPSLKLLQYMQQFSFFDQSLLDTSIVFADLGSVIRKSAEATLTEIVSRVERLEPEVVVIDSFKAVRDILGDAVRLRTFVYDLAVHTSSWGATSLLVGDYTEAEATSSPEFAIADGIVRFTNSRRELTAVREVEVLKLRGSSYATGCHSYEIGSDGLEFFPRVRGPAAAGAESHAAQVGSPFEELRGVLTGLPMPGSST